MTLHLPRRSFASLSVKDLLDAREAYHTHLLHLENVVATAIGRYRFVRTDPDDLDGLEPPKGGRGRDEERTLANSEVRRYSWPCVMVFVDRWIPKKDFATKFDAIVPPRLYLADGRVVPTCVIKADKQDEPIGEVQTLRFPETVLGGGYPSLAEVQGQTRVATVGCLVSDGDSLYALTNAHVAGDAERELYTLVRGRRQRLGRTAFDRRVTKIPFERAYPGFAGPSSVLNLDAALVEVDDARRWTSQVYGIGQFDELADLNVNTVTLDLIGCKVIAFGAASGAMSGEIQGLFYRYRSIGGQDQLADLLIGPRPAAEPDRRDPRQPASQAEVAAHVERCALMARRLGRHGNSGAVWFLEQPGDDGRVRRRPIGLHWGGQSFVAGEGQQATQYALASSLGVVCRELDVDIVRDVRIGLAERWGQVGHYKVGQLACMLPTEARLQTLLDRNVDRVSFRQDIDDTVASVDKDEEFIPLADVPDLVWKSGGKSVRGAESPNHFADMDQPSPAFDDQTLLDLSKERGFLDPERWNEFYESLDVPAMHRGLLPFRAWQLFDEMVRAVIEGKVSRFVAAAGVLAHYVGDACQPLHVSMYHDGYPGGRGRGVHSAYETNMLGGEYALELNQKVAALIENKKPRLHQVESGRDAAHQVVALMRRSIEAIPPRSIVDCYIDGHPKLAALWDAFGDRTAERFVDGAQVLASLWRGAWIAGDHDAHVGDHQLRAVPRPDLAELYLDRTFARSVTLPRMSIAAGKLVIADG